ncbi:hypothetical protein PHYBOEH_007699 [Phytophthora boehmeriae]|uniref:Expansin-like EG45 domain-containing protein n=1 Tax=Phytophthora boehmeriae TaxID=109152 RepID=A0A8T1W659_9STRA|nr:hypothetical protein PHYBOEH_007699 [Phytophthora boehmeriae]
MSWPSDATTKYAALNAEQWEETMNCGRCAEVWCTDSSCASQSSEIVYIMDQCPGCEYGDLDLSPDVFEGITGQSYTKLGIEWKFVDCPISKNVEYCLKTGSSEFWVAIQPANFVSGVQSLKINGQETTVIDSAYYFLIDGSGESVADLNAVSISLTGVNGEVLEETVSLTADNCTEGNSQFSTSDATQSEIMAGSKSSTATTTSAPATATTPSPTPTPVHTPTQTPTAAPGPETNQMASSSGSSSTLRSNSDKAASSVDQDVAASVDEDIYQVSGSTDSQAPVTIAATDTGSVEQSSNATPTPTYQANVKSSGESSSTPLMVGMIILVCAAVLVAVGLALYVRRRKKQIDSYKRREEQGTAMSDDDTSPRASDASAYDIVHSPTVHFHP